MLTMLYYRQYGCEGGDIHLGYPGDDNLADVDFANLALSFICVDSST